MEQCSSFPITLYYINMHTYIQYIVCVLVFTAMLSKILFHLLRVSRERNFISVREKLQRKLQRIESGMHLKYRFFASSVANLVFLLSFRSVFILIWQLHFYGSKFIYLPRKFILGKSAKCSYEKLSIVIDFEFPLKD